MRCCVARAAPHEREPRRSRQSAVIEQLRRVRWALAVIAGLTGALAVHLAFVLTWLPRLAGSARLTGDATDALAALAASLGFALFFLLALGVDRRNSG